MLHKKLMMDIFAALQVMGPVYMREGEIGRVCLHINYEFNLTSIYVYQT